MLLCDRIDDVVYKTHNESMLKVGDGEYSDKFDFFVCKLMHSSDMKLKNIENIRNIKRFESNMTMTMHLNRINILQG